MQGKLKELIKKLEEDHKEDFKYRRKRVSRMRSDADKLEQYIPLREDWGEKRSKSILRELERLGVVITDINDDHLIAKWKDITLKGKLKYETRGSTHSTSVWTRPRMALRLWMVNKKGETLRSYNGETFHHDTYGGEALSLIFGKKRLMVYDRLLTAMMNGMGK